MQIAGKQVWDILAQHGWSPNPEGYISPFFIEQEGDKFYVDINSAAVRHGSKPEEMPDCPVRIFFKPLDSSTTTVVLDAVEVRELKEDESSKAEARRGFYPKVSPWPMKK
jgi:hypothetical protein